MLDQGLEDAWWTSVNSEVLDQKQTLSQVRALVKDDVTILITHASFQTTEDPVWYEFEKDHPPQFSISQLQSSFLSWCRSQEKDWSAQLEKSLLPKLQSEMDAKVNDQLTSHVHEQVNASLPGYLASISDSTQKEIASTQKELLASAEDFFKTSRIQWEKRYQEESEKNFSVIKSETEAHAKQFLENDLLPLITPLIESLWKEHLPELSRKISMEVLRKIEGSFNQFKQSQESYVQQELLSHAMDIMQHNMHTQMEEIIAKEMKEIAPALSENLFAKISAEMAATHERLEEAIERFSSAPPWQSAEPPFLK